MKAIRPLFILAATSIGLRHKHELAELRAVLHQLVRASGVGERERAVNDGANLPALDEFHRVEQLRLRTHEGAEQVQVPVSREEVRVEREPITDANRDAAYSGPAISEEEHEVTLRAERPVVETEAVPDERVRLDKEKVTDTETVSGEVRKEKVELDEPTRGRRKR